MSKLIDLAGQIFNKLTVIKYAGNNKHGAATWKCLCECGNTTTAIGADIRSGHTQSCGCLKTYLPQTHGMSHTPEYNNYMHMLNRCYNPSNNRFKDYGGRSITICDEWRNDFMAFYNYIGSKPSPLHSIERINNNGNYEPGNIKWALPKEQANNKRNNHLLTINGETHTIMQWARIVKMKPARLYQRIYKGLSPEQAICQPVRHVT